MFAKEYYKPREHGRPSRPFSDKSKWYNVFYAVEEDPELLAAFVDLLEKKLRWKKGYPEVEVVKGSTSAKTPSSDYSIKVLLGKVRDVTVKHHFGAWCEYATLKLIPETDVAVVRVEREDYRFGQYEISRAYYIIKREVE
jgi:hypothetical protein